MKKKLKRLSKLCKLHKRANDIWTNNELSYKDRFDLIFSDEISNKIYDFIDFDYYNPDTDYKEDVDAFMNAFNDAFKGYVRLMFKL